MPQAEPENHDVPNVPVVLLTGASGYVGGRLIPLLERQPVVLRCLARNPDKLRPLVKDSTQVVRGDVLDPASLTEALHEGLKNPTVVRDKTALEVFPIHPVGVKEAIRRAIASTTEAVAISSSP